MIFYLPVLKKIIAGLSESVKILPKRWNLFNFFTCDFLFLKISCFIAIIATLGFSGPQTHDFQNKKSHMKNLNSFQHFGNILTDSESPAIWINLIKSFFRLF
jgi:hypothetical protein